MLKVNHFNTAYWGYIPTAMDFYPCHEKVNAFIGASGSGKTTLMDAIRIALGDSKFENSRNMDHYIHPNSNWSVTCLSFANTVLEDRPFESFGFKNEEVTVCVRLDRSKQDLKREYYLFDELFTDINDLGQNPKMYRKRQIKYGDYIKLLEKVGLTQSFRRLMMMRPEDVQNVANLPPHQLFQLVFDLKGQKKIQEEHQLAQKKTNDLKQQEDMTTNELNEAEKRKRDFEEKKSLYEEHQRNQKEFEEVKVLRLKRELWDNKKKIEEKENNLLETRKESEDIKSNQAELHSELESLDKELKNVEQLLEKVEDNSTTTLEKAREYEISFGRYEQKKNDLKQEIDMLQKIEIEDIQALNYSISQLESRYLEKNLIKRKYEEEYKEISKMIKEIGNGNGGVAHWVKTYAKTLSENKVPYKLLADCISIQAEFESWLEAIEGLLGNERYRIVVSKSSQLKAKQLQEACEYRARVSLPKKTLQKVNYTKLQNKYPSLRSVLKLEFEDEIGGYLDRFNEIYLVDTVEEGHQLIQAGYKNLTKKGLLQDNDGSLFLKTDRLICGKMARERYLKQLQVQLHTISENVSKIQQECSALDIERKELNQKLSLQKKRQSLSQLSLEYQELKNKYEELEQQKDHWFDQHKLLEIKKKEILDHKEKLSVQKEGKRVNLQRYTEKADSIEKAIELTIVKIEELEEALIDTKNKLFDLGIGEDSIQFLDVEVLQDKIFVRKEDKKEWTLVLLQTRYDELSQKIRENKYLVKDINESIIAMVEQQKERVDALNQYLEKVKGEREEWEDRLATAEITFRNHVNETMKQYIEEFIDMVSLLGAKGSGKFEQEGSNHNQWKLNIRLGFDGKDLTPYYDPTFSSGQRAAISIMLLIAALNNKREGLQNSIMFLDEPTARVDDERANEIGILLQSTNIQYFITHQSSASLRSVDWIDHGFVTSKLQKGESFAALPIFESRRVEHYE
jgi:chromosome segregation ATPase